MARTLVKVPATAKRGDVIELRALIQHPMETGYRPGADGRIVPRDILRRFTCHYDGELVFAAELFPAIAANPYFTFSTVASNSGTLVFRWGGDNGFAQEESHAITVTD